MLSRLKINKYLVILLMLFLFSGCVTIYNPATQRKERLLIGTEDEVALGRKMDAQIHRKLKIPQDPYRQYRVDNIGAKVAKVSDRQDLVYYFRVVKDDEFNAFAVPGGFIYVNSGLMDAATDDELACVLAHEIGHIAARHSVKKLQAVLGYQILMGIAVGISGQETIARAVDIVFDLASLRYSRKDELLSDKLAVKYARKAGFNPRGMVTFFQKLEKEAKKKGGTLHIEIFSSHPDLQERIKKAEEEIAANP